MPRNSFELARLVSRETIEKAVGGKRKRQSTAKGWKIVQTDAADNDSHSLRPSSWLVGCYLAANMPDALALGF